MELLMVSLATCSCHTIKYLLESSKGRVTDVQATATGNRRLDAHPGVLALAGRDLPRIGKERAIRTAEEKRCPVWAMLKGNVEIGWTYTIK